MATARAVALCKMYTVRFSSMLVPLVPARAKAKRENVSEPPVNPAKVRCSGIGCCDWAFFAWGAVNARVGHPCKSESKEKNMNEATGNGTKLCCSAIARGHWAFLANGSCHARPGRPCKHETKDKTRQSRASKRHKIPWLRNPTRPLGVSRAGVTRAPPQRPATQQKQRISDSKPAMRPQPELRPVAELMGRRTEGGVELSKGSFFMLHVACTRNCTARDTVCRLLAVQRNEHKHCCLFLMFDRSLLLLGVSLTCRNKSRDRYFQARHVPWRLFGPTTVLHFCTPARCLTASFISCCANSTELGSFWIDVHSKALIFSCCPDLLLLTLPNALAPWTGLA